MDLFAAHLPVFILGSSSAWRERVGWVKQQQKQQLVVAGSNSGSWLASISGAQQQQLVVAAIALCRACHWVWQHSSSHHFLHLRGDPDTAAAVAGRLLWPVWEQAPRSALPPFLTLQRASMPELVTAEWKIHVCFGIHLCLGIGTPVRDLGIVALRARSEWE